MKGQFTRRHLEAIKQSVRGLQRAPWTACVTVFTITLILILPLFLGLLMGQLKPLVSDWRQGKEVSLYLDDSFRPQDEADLMGRILATEGVYSAVFVSPEASLKALESQEGMEDIRQYLPENPLPAMIEVMPKHTIDTPEKLERLAARLKQYTHVEQARLNRDWVGKLYAALDFLTHLTWFFGALFGFMVVFIIRNLLRLAAHEHYEEIQVLKLIGATDAFILRPFLYTGVLLGGCGALGAFFGVHLILSGLLQALQHLVTPALGMPIALKLSVKQALNCLLLGIVLGWIGAYLPLKHQLARVEACH